VNSDPKIPGYSAEITGSATPICCHIAKLRKMPPGYHENEDNAQEFEIALAAGASHWNDTSFSEF
jgi:hypothetical protein